MGIQALREQRKALAKEARHIYDTTADGGWSEEVAAKYDGIMAEIDQVDEKIGRVEKLFAVESSNQDRINNRADLLAVSTDEAEASIAKERAIFVTYLRGGLSALSEDQQQHVRELAIQNALSTGAAIQNTMSTGTGSEGGYTVPTEFARGVIEEMKAFGGMRNLATILPTKTGAAFDHPTSDPTSETGELVGENAPVGAQTDPAFGTKALGAYKFSSKPVAVPFELLQDSGIDIEAYIKGRLVQRIARITNTYFTTGTGTAQPQGIVPASAQGKVGTTGQTASVIYDDLVDLQHSVNLAYRQGGKCAWSFCDSTLKILKKLKDADGRPLWLPGLAVKEPDTILGFRYELNEEIPAMAANAKSILFGDFSYYVIRDVMNFLLFRMTDSKYTEKGQVGFLAFSRHDGKLMDFGGKSVKHYANSAT